MVQCTFPPKPALTATVPLDALTLVIPTLPKGSDLWPVRAATAPGSGPYVLAGTAEDVTLLLQQYPAPLYVVSDAVIPGVPTLFARIADGQWEAAVAMVCSQHVATIPEMILAHAKKNPTRVALKSEDGPLTFAELCGQAARLGRELEAFGVQPGDNVGILMPTNQRAVVALLALGFLGCTAVQLSASEGTREKQLLKVAQQGVVLARVLCAAKLDGLPCPSTRLDQIQLDPLPLDQVVDQSDLEGTCQVGWTSGSTGFPKALAVTQWKLSHWIRWREFHFPLEKEGRNVAMSLFFYWYWHIPLCQGGCLVLVPERFMVDIPQMVRYLTDQEVDWVDCLTPGQMQLIAELCAEKDWPERLKLVMSSGEALPISVARQFLKKFPKIRVCNVLSTTETSADISYLEVTTELLDKVDGVTKMVPVRDDRGLGGVVWGNAVDVDAEGRVLSSGWNVEKGYWFGEDPGAFQPGETNVFRSGDRGAWHKGVLFIEGRLDSVVKVRGSRVDLLGVEAQMAASPDVQDCAVVSARDQVWALVVTDRLSKCRQFVQREFEPKQRPIVLQVAAIPYGETGKKNRKQCLELLPSEAQLSSTDAATSASTGSTPATSQPPPPAKPYAWSETEILAAFREHLGFPIGRAQCFFEEGGHSLQAVKLAAQLKIPVGDLLENSTAASLAKFLRAGDEQHGYQQKHSGPLNVAGMAVRLPKAERVDEFWAALRGRRDLLTEIKHHEGYVPRKGLVQDRGLDLDFWQTPKEQAELMSSEQRLALELSYEALEDAGFDPFHVGARTGVFLSGGSLHHLQGLDELRTEDPARYFATEIGHDKDYLATNVAYRLDLRGPAENIQAACSSSLVAIARGVHALRLGLCDVAVCGGVSCSPDEAQKAVDGMIWAADGVCRPFSDDANGTAHSDGGGVVVLTRPGLGAQPYAFVHGVGLNNDGRQKANFSQPSVSGQTDVIRMALADAQWDSLDVDYVETHGTGTKLGDRLEAEALARVFPRDAGRELLIGSVKGNIGHLNTAAGVAGFIKAALCAHHNEVPASMHWDVPSTMIDWRGPVQVAQGGESALQIGVSSFGIGGTNAHILLMGDAYRTRALGRRHGLFVASGDRSGPVARRIERPLDLGAEAVLSRAPTGAFRGFRVGDTQVPPTDQRRPVVLLFVGHGNAYAGMGTELEQAGLVEAWERKNEAADIVEVSLQVADLVAAQLARDPRAGPVKAVLGHSLGEWAACAFAGVVSREDARRVVRQRGELVKTLQRGQMLSVRAEKHAVAPLLPSGCCVCVDNGSSCVVGGKDLAQAQAALGEAGLQTRLLATTTAFHTALVDPILDPYEQLLQDVPFAAPAVPVVSTHSGQLLGPQSAARWRRQLRDPVEFDQALRTVKEQWPDALIVEVGPSTLAGVVAKRSVELGAKWLVQPTLRPGEEEQTLLQALGRVYCAQGGVPELPRPTRSCLAPFPFERTDVRPKQAAQVAKQQAQAPSCGPEMYEVSWEEVQVSEAHVPFLPVVLDGASEEFLAACQLPPHRVVSASGALAAASRFGRVAFVGGLSDELDLAGLCWRVLELLVALAKGPKPEVFVLLAKHPRYAPVRGLLRTLRKEHPELRLRLLTVDGPAVLPAMPVEAKVLGGRVLIPKLKAAQCPAGEPHMAKTVLVTGAFRGVGLEVVRSLVPKHDRVLAAGRAWPADRSALDAVVALGAEAVLCDVGEQQSVNKLPDVDLVVHCAGVIDDKLIAQVDEPGLRRMFKAKVDGTQLLRKRFPTARIVAFSSSSSPLGVVGQGTYAAANAYLDELLGGDAIQWGGWAGTGMSVDHNVKPLAGERFHSVEQGLEQLHRVLKARRSDPCLVLDVDWPVYASNAQVFLEEDVLLDRFAPKRPLRGEQSQVGNVTVLEAFLGRGAWQPLRQHVVDDKLICPATAYLSWAIEALATEETKALQLLDCRFLRPLDMSQKKPCQLSVAYHGATEGTVSISCDGVLHCSMRFRQAQPLKEHAAAFGGRPVEPYRVFPEQGFHYGPLFAQLADAKVDGARGCATLAGPLPLGRLCPGKLDSSLQLLSCLDSGVMGVPVRIDELTWCPGAPDRVVADGGRVLLFSGDACVVRCRGVQLQALKTPVQFALKRPVVRHEPAPAALPALARVEDAEAVLAASEQVRVEGPEAQELGGLCADRGVACADAQGLRVEHLEPCPPPEPRGGLPYVVTVDDGVGFAHSPPKQALADDEVEIATSYWALNFRDVLVGKGLMSSVVAGKALGIGGECSGVVTRAGSKSGLAVGDKVVALPPDGLGSHCVTNARWAAKAPCEDLEQAVAGTMVYATAWLGLKHLARIGPQDRVLVHSAAGGVGLAAVHLCRQAGCRVFATASTPEKRELLLSLGCEGAWNSRDPGAFAKGIQDGPGQVDVVLNSLSGEAMTTSFELLGPFGRFIELGKRDQYDGTQVSLAPFLKGLLYATAHVDVLMLECPDRARALFEEVWQALPTLPALPVTTFGMPELSKSLDYMSTGQHIGKILIRTEPVDVLPARPRVLGPPDDAVFRELRPLGAQDGAEVCRVIPDYAPGCRELVQGCAAVVTRSQRVAAVAAAAKVPLVLELRTWAAPPRSVFGLAGHVVLVEEEKSGAVQDWLADVVSDMVGLEVDPDRTFESYGIDSLALITLARRLSVKSGLPISITDLYEHPTVNALLKSIAAPAPAPQARAKVLCLHGFRTNKELLALQLGPLLNGLPLDLVFVNATRPSTGAHDERIPASTATFEWWGVPDEPYDVAWRKTDGMEETERALPEGPFDGVIGFSQGAALACLVPSKWCVCFSAVMPPRGFASRPSLHVYDPQEQVADECVAVAEAFDAPLTILHDEGHVVAKSAQVREQLHAFIQAQL